MAPDDPVAAAESAPVRPAPVRPAPARPAEPKKRPDPRPMRLALGAGTLAAVSFMAAGLVRYPVPAADGASGAGAGDATTADTLTTEVVATARPEVRIKHKTVYIHLKPGQKAPKGAKVIEGTAPPPRVVVTRIKAKPATTRQTRVRRVVTRTRQSGR